MLPPAAAPAWIPCPLMEGPCPLMEGPAPQTLAEAQGPTAPSRAHSPLLTRAALGPWLALLRVALVIPLNPGLRCQMG